MSLIPYNRPPLRLYGEIPVFSDSDDYTENYERISGDHIAAIDKGIANPFMREDYWQQIELSTCLLIDQYLQSGQKILDVGVGLARLLEQFPTLDRYGMDISYGYLSRVKDKDIQLCYARIEDMPYQKEFFDAIVCTDVLEHVLDLNASCEKILSVLKPGGLLFIRVPYKEDVSPYIASEYPYEYVHLRSFDKGSVQMLFTKIFKCEVLQVSMSGYDIVPTRQNKDNNKFLQENVLTSLEGISHTDRSYVYPVVLSDFYEPYEINIVVRKPSHEKNLLPITTPIQGKLAFSAHSYTQKQNAALDGLLKWAYQTASQLQEKNQYLNSEIEKLNDDIVQLNKRYNEMQADSFTSKTRLIDVGQLNLAQLESYKQQYKVMKDHLVKQLELAQSQYSTMVNSTQSQYTQIVADLRVANTEALLKSKNLSDLYQREQEALATVNAELTHAQAELQQTRALLDEERQKASAQQQQNQEALALVDEQLNQTRTAHDNLYQTLTVVQTKLQVTEIENERVLQSNAQIQEGAKAMQTRFDLVYEEIENKIGQAKHDREAAIAETQNAQDVLRTMGEQYQVMIDQMKAQSNLAQSQFNEMSQALVLSIQSEQKRNQELLAFIKAINDRHPDVEMLSRLPVRGAIALCSPQPIRTFTRRTIAWLKK